jgi:hypothetical protein
MCSVTNTQFQDGEPLGEYERLDVNDLSVRNNLAIEGAGCHHPKCARPKEFPAAVRAVVLREIESFNTFNTLCTRPRRISRSMPASEY